MPASNLKSLASYQATPAATVATNVAQEQASIGNGVIVETTLPTATANEVVTPPPPAVTNTSMESSASAAVAASVSTEVGSEDVGLTAPPAPVEQTVVVTTNAPASGVTAAGAEPCAQEVKWLNDCVAANSGSAAYVLGTRERAGDHKNMKNILAVEGGTTMSVLEQQQIELYEFPHLSLSRHVYVPTKVRGIRIAVARVPQGRLDVGGCCYGRRAWIGSGRIGPGLGVVG